MNATTEAQELSEYTLFCCSIVGFDVMSYQVAYTPQLRDDERCREQHIKVTS